MRFAQSIRGGNGLTGHGGKDDLVWFASLANVISKRFQHRVVMNGHQRSPAHHVLQQSSPDTASKLAHSRHSCAQVD
jgi:hypothetical protein